MIENTEKTRLTDRKRAAILLAAVNEFQKNGFDGTSMDRIAETAEVSKRTVYNHFPSKDELFTAMVVELSQRCGGMECRYSATEPLEDQLLEIAKIYVEKITNEDFIKLSRVVISRFMQAPELASSIRDKNQFQFAIVDWIKSAKKDGRLSVTNVEQAATQFSSLIKAFAFWPQIISDEAPPTKRELGRIAKNTVEMFLSHYRS